MNKRAVNWWKLITQLSTDKTKWDYLEPAEIVEILQRIAEAKEKIIGLEKYLHIDLSPAFQKLGTLMNHLHINDFQENLNPIN
jgi:hypothetical protein